MSTAIEWTDETWNPVTGCTKVSAGCEHCYAIRVAHRYGGGTQQGSFAGLTTQHRDGTVNWTGKVMLHQERLDAPLHWRKPRRVFVNSMSDLFHPEVPDEFIGFVWATMAHTPQHTYQVLTKRPERMVEWIECCWNPAWLEEKVLSNVWLGVSCEDQQTADQRILHLLTTPARVRFVSAEPLLGPIDLCSYLPYSERLGREFGYRVARGATRLAGLPRLDWVIVGGESGGPPERRLVEKCRPFDSGYENGAIYSVPCADCDGTGWRPQSKVLAWVRSLRDQCQAAGVAFFHKQWGGPTPTSGGRVLDGRTWEEYPAPAQSPSAQTPGDHH